MQHQKIVDSQATYLTYSVVCLVDSDSKNLGKVTSCSVNSQKYLGIPASDIIGRNINSIMPSSIAHVHDSLLKS